MSKQIELRAVIASFNDGVVARIKNGVAIPDVRIQELQEAFYNDLGISQPLDNTRDILLWLDVRDFWLVASWTTTMNIVLAGNLNIPVNRLPTAYHLSCQDLGEALSI